MVNIYKRQRNNLLRKTIALVIVLVGHFFVTTVSAQNKIEIFADTQDNDTLQQLVTAFTTQLKKSTAATFVTRPASQYSGKGIYLNNSTRTNQPVKSSSKLLQSGVEAFSGEANSNTVQIIGNSNMAIGHGIFTYLDLIGYRFYFANPDWHIIPDKPNLFPKWSIVSRPAFDHRRIWYGYGTGSTIADNDYNFWVMSNRLGGSINAYFGHAYEEIISRNREVFLQHPEWFYPKAPKGTIPPGEGLKFDMTREDLVQFLIQDFEKRIQASLKNKTTDYKMLSLAPSDGLGTCNTPACQQLGTLTDRVYYLVNRVAKALQKKYPATMIGCLAYGEYIAPPTKNVEPNVFVGITTAFNTTKYSTEQLVEEWRKKGAFVGIYDYFSWYAWDYDIPGQSLASKTKDIVKTVKNYYDKGVRAYEAESSIGWMSKGLGYYLAAKTMWDIKTDAESLKKEFFKLCFGNAADEMKKLWQDWESYSFSNIRPGDLAKWIDRTTEATKLEQSGAFKNRLFQIRSYLHWLYLYSMYESNKSEANLLALLNYGYRKLDDGSVSGFPAVTVLGNPSGFKDMGLVENPKWKYNSSPVTAEEIDRLIADDRRKIKVAEPVKENTLTQKFINVPNVKKFGALTADSATGDNAYWITNEWVFEIKNKGTQNFIDFTGDYIGDKTVVKPIKISVYPYAADGNVNTQAPLIRIDYTATKVKQKIDLGQLATGYYTMIIEDPVKIFRLSFSPSVNFSMVMRPERQINTTAFFYAFLYVPEGTKKFNIIKSANLDLVTPTGRQLSFGKDKAEEAQVDVQKNEAGLWRIKLLTGKLYVEGIPPYVGTSVSQMLIPADAK